jgi:fructose-1,6-bisphosphatase/inositol monophosphatase family enzyme
MPPCPAIDIDRSLDRLKAIQRRMRDAFIRDMRHSSAGERSAVASFGAGDYIYAIDRSVEHSLLAECRLWAQEQPLRLIAEGLGDSGEMVLPEGATAADACFCVVVDPLDGTRGLMYDKRSAWILAGLAPNRGPATNLSDIVLAVQTEVPTTKQYLADVLWATRGSGAHGERDNLLTGETQPLTFAPSRATDLAHGFASLTKFFPGRKPIVAEIEEALIREVDGLQPPGKVRVFDDQYISSGGQLYELMVGHDRFNGDIRPALMKSSHLPGDPPGLAAHPYDLCSELIAREAGVIVTDLTGHPLATPLNVDDNVAWLGYANASLYRRIEPVLQRILRQYGLIAHA